MLGLELRARCDKLWKFAVNFGPKWLTNIIFFKTNYTSSTKKEILVWKIQHNE